MKKIASIIFYTFILFLNLNAANNKETQAVVFDFGGVIAKADTAHMASFLMNTFKINKEELYKALKEMQQYVSAGGSEKLFWEKYALSKDIVLPSDWFEQFEIVITSSIVEIPGTVMIVKELKRQGYQTAMLSDITQYQAAIIRKMGYYELFNPTLLSYEIGVNKPNKEAFQILLERLNLPPSSIIFIDDKIENVNGAKSLEIDAIHFINPEALKDELEKRGFKLE